MTARERADALQDMYMPVSPDVGRLLYAPVLRLLQPRLERGVPGQGRHRDQLLDRPVTPGAAAVLATGCSGGRSTLMCAWWSLAPAVGGPVKQHDKAAQADTAQGHSGKSQKFHHASLSGTPSSSRTLGAILLVVEQCSSMHMRWAWEDLNLRPLPYQSVGRAAWVVILPA
jgi:hypothetical protein